MANFIPPEFIEEISRRLDIVELVSRYVSLKKQGRNFVGLCPFHSEDTPSFIVSPDKQIFHCFGCHKGGNGINFLMSVENLTFPEAVEKLSGQLGLELPKQELTPDEQEKMKARKTYYELNNLAADFFQNNLWSTKGEVARAYLEKRGLTSELVKKFKLGFATNDWDGLLNYLLGKGYSHKQIDEAGLVSRKDLNTSDGNPKYFDRFRQRVMFPIQDFKGQVIAFGGRIMGDGQPKYLNSPETLMFHKSQNLYGLFVAGADIRKLDEAVIMEGYMDVITAHQFGVHNAIASLGTAFTKEHGALLRRYSNNVLLAYDGDGAGVKAAAKGLEILKEQGANVRVVLFPDNLDPDDFLRQHGKPGWEDLVSEKALDYWGFKLQEALKKHDISTISGKGALVNELLPYILSSNNQVERDGFVGLVARTIGIPADAIYADLQKQGLSAAKLVRARSPQQVEKTASSHNFQKLDKKSANLVFFMLHSKAVYEKVEENLGLDFTDNKVLQELIGLVQKIKEDYNWQPATLFSYLPEGDSKQFLLRGLSADWDLTKIDKLAWGCIQSLKGDLLQQEIAEKQEILKTATSADGTKILAALMDLQNQVRKLRED